MRMLLYGPAGTGKTTELLNQYIELKKAAPLRRDVYYLVPTSEHADRIMALALARINPLFSANITTLDKFLGGEKSLSDLEQRLILRKICEGLELEYFGEAQKSAVFYAGLAELLGELKRLCLGQSDLCAKLPNSAKARDLQKIFTEYAQYLRANGLQDREDVLAAYAAPPENCFIFIDGFTDYTPLQYAQLKKLCAGGHSVTAALTYTEEQKDFFAGPAAGVLQTFQSWGFALQKCQEYRRSAAADLKNFALHWGQKKEFTCQNIQILSAGNRGQEIELIARRIAAYKKENPRARWSDIAIIFRSIGAYQFLINEIFLKYQIPVEIHEGIEILQNPFCNLLLSLRDARDNEEVLLAVLKSAYSRAPLEKVRELEFRRAENPDIELEISAPELKNHIAQILDCSAKLRAARNFADLQEVWENFYADNNCAAELKKDLDNPALQTTVRHSNRAYKAMLDALTVLQHWQKKLKLKLSAEELWETFVSALTAKTASRGRNGEQVQVYDALSARQKDYSSVFLANLTLNSWPAGAAENFLLREYEKTSLGLARTEDKMRKEDLIFYQAFTRAAERVYLCFARSEAGGKPLLPSPYVSLLKKFFKNIPEETYSRSAVLDGAEPLCREEYAQSAIYRFCNQEHQSLAAARKSAREKDLECVLAILKQKNDPAQLHQFARTAETELQKLNHFSVTQLEKYSRCAFRFFCEDVLKLRGRPEDKTNLTIGSLMHKVLELSYLDQQTDLDKLVEDIWNSTEFKGKLKLLHGQAEAERKKISFILKRFIEQDKLVSAERNFWPAEYEKKMSARDCAVYKLGGNTLSGTIDRVDKNAAEDFLIIDYKSGQLPQLEPAELEKGILPQALVYALIYRELSGLSPAGAEYCGLKKNKRSGLYSAKYQNLIRSKKFVTPAEFTKILNNLRSKLAEYFAAIQRGEFWQNNEEKCPEYCTASEICRQKQTGAPI